MYAKPFISTLALVQQFRCLTLCILTGMFIQLNKKKMDEYEAYPQ